MVMIAPLLVFVLVLILVLILVSSAVVILCSCVMLHRAPLILLRPIFPPPCPMAVRLIVRIIARRAGRSADWCPSLHGSSGRRECCIGVGRGRHPVCEHVLVKGTLAR